MARTLSGAAVLVTGATGGLGAPIVRILVQRGALVLGVSRSTGFDLTMRGEPERAVAEAVDRFGRLDGVVNALGVVAFGNLVDTDDVTLERLVAVNLLAPLRVARAALPVLPSGGFVANVSAVVAEQPTAGMVAYSATKAGLTAADAALYREARRRQVSVIDLRPPHTETGLALRPIAGSPPRLPTGLDPEAVAARIVAAIEADEREVPAAAFAGA